MWSIVNEVASYIALGLSVLNFIMIEADRRTSEKNRSRRSTTTDKDGGPLGPLRG